MNERRVAEENDVRNVEGGWYSTRRLYRSVAFGTWKVGGARGLCIKRGISEDGRQFVRSLDTNENHSMAAVNQFHTLKSTENFGISINYDCNRSFDGTMVAAEEVSTVARRRRTGRQQRGEGTAFEFRPINVSDIGDRINRDRKRLTEFGDQVLNRSCSSLSRRTRDRIVTTIQRVHQRSRSAGNDNHFTLCSLPHKHRAPRGSMPFTRFSNYSGGGGSIGGDSCSTGGSSSGGGLLNPLKATKKFLKKIYDTATLPNRLHSKGLAATVTEQQNEIPTTSLLPVNSIFDASYSLEVSDDEIPDQRDRCKTATNEYAANSSVTAVSYDFHSAPLSAPLKQATAIPDDSVNDSGLSRSISSSESQKTSSGDFRSWNDVFNHLKREMAYMRQRDAQIFADLHFVEVQLRNVKNQALSSNSGDCDNGRRVLDKRQVKLGDLVESMPL